MGNSEYSTPHDMVVKALMMDPVSQMPVLILSATETDELLPIWIGLSEANAIALSLEGIKTPRPMTHDLMYSLIAELGYTVDRVLVHTLSDDVFFASVVLKNDDAAEVVLDSRPSDAIALAVRTSAKIQVHPSVLERAGASQLDSDEAMSKLLEKLRPEDLGEYEM